LLAVVTGAFSFTGRYVAERFLAEGYEVRTLTRRPDRAHPLGDRVEALPYRFDDRDALAETLRGARVLVNTYWVRCPRAGESWEATIENSRELIAAAERAGIERLIQLSVTNARLDSPYGYFRGKALVEEAVRSSGISHAILRPTLILGQEEILLNNVAWFLRRFPVFLVPGDGRYEVQPVAAEDVAELAFAAAVEEGNVERDAAGPERLSFDQVVERLSRHVESRARLVHAPARVTLALALGVRAALRDVVLTREELGALMESLLTSAEPPAGTRRFDEWLASRGDFLGRAWAS
jgi:uncharacterized protein YbjT (DUF2867 family)